MSNSIISAIEDLIDELEDSAYNGDIRWDDYIRHKRITENY
ncbi:MAG: hypothetical protein E6970_02120 [Peptostreptococcus sp.]|jgi:hypothetical protein|nr:hypothetical protein [Peptostreptococcus sp.]MDU1264602.1 hypothetical protein [Peptostreptococcus sp.]